VETRGPVIFIDDEKHVRMSVKQSLELAKHRTLCFASAKPALKHISLDWPGVIVTDVKLPRMSGLELLKRALLIDPDLPVILVTAHGGIPMAVQAMRDGAYDFIEKPFSSELLIDVIKRALEKRALVLENRGLRSEVALRSEPGPLIVGKTPVIEHLRTLIANIGDSDADVLVTGETGTGKELVARSLHQHSTRRNGAFVPINCGALPESIIESELFGHEPGAFTGARERRIGKFEFANEGTLFLDEVESMPMHLQVKILRVLQERVIERLGSNQMIPVDVRIVAASKTDLKHASSNGTFRQDLFYRLCVVHIQIPPLRERREDIPLLYQHFLLEAATRYGRRVPAVTPELMREMMKQEWPGNVREVRNAAERHVLSAEDAGSGVPAQDNRLLPNATGPAPTTKKLGLREQVQAFEKAVIEQELTRQNGKITATCAALDLPRKTLYDKMGRYRLRRADYT